MELALAADPELAAVGVGPSDLDLSLPGIGDGRVSKLDASEVVGMDEHPAKAVRSRPDNTMVVGCRHLADGAADAFFTAGNTGAALAAALFTLGRVEGVRRPALATVVPAGDRVAILLDIGANTDCAPEYLVQFALMGREYARTTLGTAEPTVGLLSNGEEASKGSKLVLEAHELMAASVPGFVGNVEGRDIPDPPVDVIVTDGFTGNVAIKLLEGTAGVLMRELAGAFTSSATTRLAGVLMRPRLRSMRARLDPDRYGGAPLLGVDGVCIVGHGNSSPKGVASGIALAARAAREDLTGRIASALA
jgi:glycerol-3-phosphate acyltransferase PlsX